MPQQPVSTPKEKGTNSPFKTLKKKIKNKFRLSKGNVKSLAEASEILKRSNEILDSSITSDPDALNQLHSEFSNLKEALECIVSQSQVLSDVIKTVDSTCPDPFEQPENFLIFFAQRSVSSRSSLSDEFDLDSRKEKDIQDVEENGYDKKNKELEQSISKLQAMRLEEQRAFQAERANYEARIQQIMLLEDEIEHLRKQNSEHQIQFDFLKSQTHGKKSNDYETAHVGTVDNENLESFQINNEKLANDFAAVQAENVMLLEKLADLELQLDAEVTKRDAYLQNSRNRIAELEDELNGLKISTQAKGQSEIVPGSVADAETETDNETVFIVQLKEQNLQLHQQLETTLSHLKALQEDNEKDPEREVKFRELSEENVRLKLELDELMHKIENQDSSHCGVNVNIINGIEEIKSEKIDIIPPKHAETSPDESAFKYIYLSNLVLKFMQNPDQRPELSHVIYSTLLADQSYFQKTNI